MLRLRERKGEGRRGSIDHLRWEFSTWLFTIGSGHDCGPREKTRSIRRIQREVAKTESGLNERGEHATTTEGMRFVRRRPSYGKEIRTTSNEISTIRPSREEGRASGRPASSPVGRFVESVQTSRALSRDCQIRVNANSSPF